MTSLRKRVDMADELLADLIDEIGTGPGVAGLRAKAYAIKHILRDLNPDGDASLDQHKMGSMGGKARAASMSPERRKEIAIKAAKKRWKHVA